MNFYNENDPKAAAWLRALIAAGEIPPGVVDERSITEIKASELTEYVQCHFFAGIGGWPYALKLAGWPCVKPVWTGSCPCQPFSQAGKGMGEADDRHLWPVFRNLIGECRPPVAFGEQVASKAGLQWLDGVCADMEAAGYAIGAVDLCAAGVGAPHIRQRLYWVADAASERWNRLAGMQWANRRAKSQASGGMVLANGARRDSRKQTGATVGYGCPTVTASDVGGLDDTTSPRRDRAQQESEGDSRHEPRLQMSGAGREPGFWSDFDIIPCADGKTRRIESGSFPLAHGIPGRVGLLRGYGNAIVPQVAAEFIRAYIDSK